MSAAPTGPLLPKITGNEPQQENPMSNLTDTKRRRFLQTAGIAAAGLAVTGRGLIETAEAQTTPQTTAMPSQPVPSGTAIPMGPIRQVHTGDLDIGYYETGPADGHVVLLLHGFPYDIHSYVDVAPMLAGAGLPRHRALSARPRTRRALLDAATRARASRARSAPT